MADDIPSSFKSDITSAVVHGVCSLEFIFTLRFYLLTRLSTNPTGRLLLAECHQKRFLCDNRVRSIVAVFGAYIIIISVSINVSTCFHVVSPFLF